MVRLGAGSAGDLDPVATDATGRPFCRFGQDTAAGQTNGEAVDGRWYAVSASGAEVQPFTVTGSWRPRTVAPR